MHDKPAKSLPDVRLAEPADEENIMTMCQRLWEENGLFSLDEKKVAATIQRYYRRDGVILGVIGPVGKLEASTCLALGDMHYSDEWHLSELWNYVQPEFRRSHDAEALVKFGKDCAEKMGMVLLTGIITNQHMAGKVRLYRRLLGHPAGAFFVHNAPNWRKEPLDDFTALKAKLREYAQLCNNKKITFDVARKEIGPLLREAASAIAADNVWA